MGGWQKPMLVCGERFKLWIPHARNIVGHPVVREPWGAGDRHHCPECSAFCYHSILNFKQPVLAPYYPIKVLACTNLQEEQDMVTTTITPANTPAVLREATLKYANEPVSQHVRHLQGTL